MNVLVTGGAGYIGSVTIEELLTEGHDVIVLDNLKQGHQKAVPNEAELIKGDIGDKDLLVDIFGSNDIQSVIHLAAETVVEYSMTDPQRFFKENVVKGLTLLEAMLDHDVYKIIFSSSAAVYGEPSKIPITEDNPTSPINSYGESKLMYEKILDWYHRAYDLKYISLRYFNAAGATEMNGPDQEPKTHLIPIVLETALGNRDKVEIFGTDYNTTDGSCVRDYIHVLALAEAHIKSLDIINEIGHGIYNLGNNQGYSVKEVIETAQKVTEKEIPAVKSNRRKGDPAILVASNEKARKELGWQPKYNLQEIISSTWKWYQKYPNGYKD